MLEFTEGNIIPINIEDEMKNSYIDYAMSVIAGRALPDVRDGLKPVHRRILYAMYELGMTSNKPYRKSARIVGEVMGKYHPHGDAAIYDSMVRLAQDFATRYLLIDGHGNFGSVDGDRPAAMRYTEARMSTLAEELIKDIEKETVNYMPNFDGELEEPKVLPSRFPNLLVNGSSGIAVAMATNIPPHNLGEVIEAIKYLIDNPHASVDDLMNYVKGPDFPTGGLILGRSGIKEAYRTGRGSIKVQAKCRIEPMGSGKNRILVTELPYQVNKAKLIEKIADLVKIRKIDGITDLRDESDREGMRIVIELRRDVNPNTVLNQLYKHTQLEDSFGAIMVALVNGRPKTLNLKDLLWNYLEHQKDVVTRRTKFELRKAEERAHILEGLRIALANIDEVIKIVRGSESPKVARNRLMEAFDLSEKQAQEILRMTIQQLTGLEREKIEKEYKELLKTIKRLKKILSDEAEIYKLITKELIPLGEKYSDDRKSEIVGEKKELEIEDLIAEEDIVVILTHGGYIKRLPIQTYRLQRRGGKGITGISTKNDDFVEHLFITTTHNNILFLTNKGKAYVLKGHEIPEASRQARGLPLINLLSIDNDESVSAVIPIKEFDENYYLFMSTKKGIVKKSPLNEYSHVRRNGLIAISLREGDELIDVKLTDGEKNIMLVTSRGYSIRFNEENVRPLSRTAQGVKGINLSKDDSVVSMDVVSEGKNLLVITEKGFGKQTDFNEYRVQSRGGKGIKTLKITERNGNIVGAQVVNESDDIMLITAGGTLIRINTKDIKKTGRATQGVTLIRLNEKDKLVAIAKVAKK